MANNINILTENSLDNLLLDLITNDFNNPEIQKSMEITAGYLSAADVGIIINPKKEKRFLNNGRKAFFITRKRMMFFLSFIIVIVAGLFLWNTNTQPSDSSENLLFTPANPKTDSLRSNEKINMAQALPASLKTQTLADSLTLSAKIFPQVIKQENGGNPVVYIPKPKPTNNKYYEEFDAEIAASVAFGSGDEVKIYPAEYKMEGQNVRLISPLFPYIKNKSPKTAFLPVYTGKPFKKGFENCEFINPLNFYTPDKHKTPKDLILIPDALKYYFKGEINDSIILDFITRKENAKYLRPFYMSKHEVTNLNYKEFLYWVKNYNGFENLNIPGKDTNNEFSMAFRYTFHSPSKEYLARFGNNSINVYPKTDVWSQDFSSGYMEPLDDHYFTHSAYNNYPVVGISYWQALAYLDWLTWIWQSRMDKQGIPYEVEYDLPYDYEWELASKTVMEEISNSTRWNKTEQENNITNLAIINVDDKTYRKSLGLFANRLSENKKDGGIFTYPEDADFFSYKTTPSFNCMNSNVSEWIRLDYQKEWKPFSDKRNREIATRQTQASKQFLIMQNYFDSTCNNPDGKMIRGANWYDYRNNSFIEAARAKAFINPNEQHSTIGFRFVIRVKLKNENLALDKIRILGRNLPEMDYSMERRPESDNKKDWYQEVPPGFSFIPMLTFNFHDTTTSVQAFYAQQTETTNFQWMLFLNDLIDKKRTEDLLECIPHDPDWAYKMTYETDSLQASWKSTFKGYETLLLSKKFVKANKIKDIPVTSFALNPVVGISHKAVQIFARWLSEIYGDVNDFRLPTEPEWECMAYANYGKENPPFAWGGPYTRNSQGIFLANFLWSDLYYDLDTNTVKNPEAYYQSKYAGKQNLKVTHLDPSLRNYISHASISTYTVAHFPPNNFGLYDICGNVAEMLYKPDGTKGGSWASPAWYIRIDQKETWNGKPSDCVGFRLVQTYLGRK